MQRSPRTSGCASGVVSRYHADVAKMMPFAMAVVMLLGFMFLAGLYLDITKPIG